MRGFHPTAFLSLLLGLVLVSVAGAANLVVNGDFESVKEEGWTYLGVHDGSHGVFSEPTRPGTHTYLLQLFGGQPGASSSISQRIRVLPDRNYRLNLEIYDSCALKEDWPTDLVTATVEGCSVFLHPLAAADGTGWRSFAATFQAASPEAELVIRLQGSSVAREDSTTAIDNVELVEASGIEIKPFRPGYPLVPVTRRSSVPVGLAFQPPEDQLAGYEPVEEFRRLTKHTPAYLAWNFAWKPDTAPEERFADIRPHVDPWVRSGIIPILTARGPAPLEVPDDVLEPYFRDWARQLREWAYPVLLRPWPDMELQHASGSARNFTALWRKARGWFAEEGAVNVFWFWTPNTLSDVSDVFYPGDAHVDFVGCPHGPQTLDALYEHYRLHYRRKALAIPESAQPDTLASLDEFTRTLVKQYPRIEFYTHAIDRALLEKTSPPAFTSNPAWLGQSPLVQFRILQQAPPRSMATLSRQGNNVQAVVTNISDDGAPAGSDFILEFFSGHPDKGGLRVGSLRFLRLGRGREKVIQQRFPDGDTGVPHLRVTGKPGPGVMKGTSAPPPKVRVFRLVP